MTQDRSLSHALAFGEELLDDAIEVPPVIQAGQDVGGGQLLHLAEGFFQLRILVAQIAQGLLKLGVERFVLANDLGHRQVLLDHQRDGEQVIAELDDVIAGAGADGFGGDLADVLPVTMMTGVEQRWRTCRSSSMPVASGRL